MSTTKDDIKRWFAEGLRQKASHMVVIVDEFDHEDYPKYLKATEAEARETVAEYAAGKHSMQRVMEVYSMSLPRDPQVDEPRSFNYAVAAPKKKASKKKP